MSNIIPIFNSMSFTGCVVAYSTAGEQINLGQCILRPSNSDDCVVGSSNNSDPDLVWKNNVTAIAINNAAAGEQVAFINIATATSSAKFIPGVALLGSATYVLSPDGYLITKGELTDQQNIIIIGTATDNNEIELACVVTDIPGLPDSSFQGTWNASTNTPDIGAGAPYVNRSWWRVSVEGTQTFGPFVAEVFEVDEIVEYNPKLTEPWKHIKNPAQAGGGGTWGSIIGTLSNQTDLKAALDEKLSASSSSLDKLRGDSEYADFDDTATYVIGNKVSSGDRNYRAIADNGPGTFDPVDWREISIRENLETKQDTLVSTVNIKTINGETVLGSGNVNLTISASFFIPDASPFADAAARDAWAVLNLTDLRQGQTLITVTSIGSAQIWDAPTPPDSGSYVNTNWEIAPLIPGPPGVAGEASQHLAERLREVQASSGYVHGNTMSQADADYCAKAISPGATFRSDAGRIMPNWGNLAGSLGVGFFSSGVADPTVNPAALSEIIIPVDDLHPGFELRMFRSASASGGTRNIRVYTGDPTASGTEVEPLLGDQDFAIQTDPALVVFRVDDFTTALHVCFSNQFVVTAISSEDPTYSVIEQARGNFRDSCVGLTSLGYAHGSVLPNAIAAQAVRATGVIAGVSNSGGRVPFRLGIGGSSAGFYAVGNASAEPTDPAQPFNEIIIEGLTLGPNDVIEIAAGRATSGGTKMIRAYDADAAVGGGTRMTPLYGSEDDQSGTIFVTGYKNPNNGNDVHLYFNNKYIYNISVRQETTTGQVSGLSTALAAKIDLTEKAAASGVATLDTNTKIPIAQIPDGAINVVDAVNQAAFPATGRSDTIYVDTTANLPYRWNGSAYVVIASTSAAVWGTITGDVANQTDLGDLAVLDQVGTAEILDDAVTTDKVVNDAITTAKILNGNVTTDKVADAAITEPKVAANAINTAKIVDGAVTNVKLGDASVSTAKLQPNSVTTGKINDQAVTTAKIEDGAVTYAKMQNPVGTSILLGRGDSGAGDPQEITLGTNLTMTGTVLDAGSGSGGNPVYPFTDFNGAGVGWYTIIRIANVDTNISNFRSEYQWGCSNRSAAPGTMLTSCVVSISGEFNGGNDCSLAIENLTVNGSLTFDKVRLIRLNGAVPNSDVLLQVNITTATLLSASMTQYKTTSWLNETLPVTKWTDVVDQLVICELDLSSWVTRNIHTGTTSGIRAPSIGEPDEQVAIQFDGTDVDIIAGGKVVADITPSGMRLNAGQYSNYPVTQTPPMQGNATPPNLQETTNQFQNVTMLSTSVGTWSKVQESIGVTAYWTWKGGHGATDSWTMNFIGLVPGESLSGTIDIYVSGVQFVTHFDVIDMRDNSVIGTIEGTNLAEDIYRIEWSLVNPVADFNQLDIRIQKGANNGTNSLCAIYNYEFVLEVPEPPLNTNIALQVDSYDKGVMLPGVVNPNAIVFPQGAIYRDLLNRSRLCVSDGEGTAYVNASRIGFTSIDNGQFFFAEGSEGFADSGWTGSQLQRWVHTLDHQGFPAVVRITQTGGTVTAQAPNNTQALWDVARANGFRVDFRMMFGATHDGQIWVDIEPNNTSWGSNGRFEFNVTVTTGQLQITMINAGGNTTFDIDRDVMHTITMLCEPGEDVASIILEGEKIGEVTYSGGGTTDRGTFFYIPPGNPVNDMCIQSVTMYTLDAAAHDVTMDKHALETGLRYPIPNINSAMILRVPKGLYDFGTTFSVINGSTKNATVTGLPDDHQLFGGSSSHVIPATKEVLFTQTVNPRGAEWSVSDNNIGNTLELFIPSAGTSWTTRAGTYTGDVIITRPSNGQYLINIVGVTLPDSTIVHATAHGPDNVTMRYTIAIGDIDVRPYDAAVPGYVNTDFSIRIVW